MQGPTVAVWRATSALVDARRVRRFDRHPVRGVVRERDLAAVPNAGPDRRLDVLRPDRIEAPLPVLVSFHGGGWTSGDKRVTDAYCRTQAAAGTVVVNANAPLAGRGGDGDHMARVLRAADEVLGWTRRSIARFGGDPDRIVLAGDSAGAQVAALLTAAIVRPEVAERYSVAPALPPEALRGLVQHSPFADLVAAAAPWSPARALLRLLVPEGGRPFDEGAFLRAIAAVSPLELVSPAFPPVLVTTAAHDFLLGGALRLVERLRSAGVPVEGLVLGRAHDPVLHTFQQDPSLRESQLVHEHLHRFVRRVTAHPVGGVSGAA